MTVQGELDDSRAAIEMKAMTELVQPILVREKEFKIFAEKFSNKSGLGTGNTPRIQGGFQYLLRSREVSFNH